MKTIKAIRSFLLSALACVFLSSCGGADETITVLEACKVQQTQDDCLIIGQNILALSPGFENYECAWVDGQCISRVITN